MLLQKQDVMIPYFCQLEACGTSILITAAGQTFSVPAFSPFACICVCMMRPLLPCTTLVDYPSYTMPLHKSQFVTFTATTT
jgi:hypothetical protein